MARPKKINNQELSHEDQQIAFVASQATNSDKVSWNRKFNNLQKVLDILHPMEETITELTGKCMPLYNTISELRKVLVEECIHPADMLVHKGDSLECKFCLKTIVIK